MKRALKSQKEIEAVAREVWDFMAVDVGKRPVVVALAGPLGAGKTTFTKELAKIAGVKSVVSSPTFVLHIPHRTENENVRLEHIDVYRMEVWGELEQIGFNKMLDDKAVVIIEWADKFQKEVDELRTLGVRVIRIEFEYGEMDEERIIEIKI
jgi:tRNA threonylcarbamoyladenosine biosynthesis protein TsaE